MQDFGGSSLRPRRPGAGFGWFVGKLFQWEFGLGPDYSVYGPNSPQASDLRSLAGVENIRNDFYNKNGSSLGNGCGCSNITYTGGDVAFGHAGFFNALKNGNWTSLFVGKFDVHVYPSDDCSTLTFAATNTTSLPSYVMFGRDWVPEWERDQYYGFAGNMRQMIWWTEPVR